MGTVNFQEVDQLLVLSDKDLKLVFNVCIFASTEALRGLSRRLFAREEPNQIVNLRAI